MELFCGVSIPDGGRLRSTEASVVALLVVLCGLGLGGCTTDTESPSRPNILFIMADDHTTQAFRSYGSRLSGLAPTEHINRLAQQGARLTNAFVTNSICVPSRASILTGQYSHKNGAYTLRDSLAPAHPNVAKELQKGGYQTAVIGKWHLKAEPSGFDYWNVLPGQGRYVDPRLREKGSDTLTTHGGFSADVIADLSLDWLKQQRDEEKPFVLMTHFKASHGPFQAPKRNDSLFADTTLPEPPSLWEDKSHRSPGSREYGFTIETMARRFVRWGYWAPPRPLDKMSGREVRRHGYQAFVKQYLRSVAAIDQNVGRLLDYLKKAGLKENTVVIYTSDQGYFLGEHNYIDKRWMYEESMQMPFLIRYPGEIEPGTVVDDLVLNVDFAPLMLDYAGLKTPDYMQGRSFRPNLRGETPADWRDAVYYRYWMHGNGARRPAHYGIRTKRFKLIFFYGLPLDQTSNPPTKPGWELYDLVKDPREMDNVYRDPAYADTGARLKDKLLQLKDRLGDPDEAYPALMERRRSHW
ncbi:MAG: sulfatase [Salinibacter sp.]|uniref:sulfatase n=1 Tax=Salinibacter sp. TaxID=2065818 RepID=UPI0035D4C95A